jgi:hypothetical protein
VTPREVRASDRAGAAGLCPAKPERGRAWEPFQGSMQTLRGVIRDQCLTKINRLKDEDGITVE